MIELTPEQVEEKFGKRFSKSVITMVDERNKIVEIMEKCRFRGVAELSLITRLRNSDLIYEGWVEGKTAIMRANIGKSHLTHTRGFIQALKSVEIVGNSVHTTWVETEEEITACLPQARGVIRAIYPQSDLFKEVTIVTPKYHKLIIGVDDTDSEKGSPTWVQSMVAVMKVIEKYKNVILLAHRIFQGNPDIPWKTDINVSTVIVLAVSSRISISNIINDFINELKRRVKSEEACAVFYNGILIPEELISFSKKVKSDTVDEFEALKIAKRNGIVVAEISGIKGVIGALAGISYYDMGIDAASLFEDEGLSKIRFRYIDRHEEKNADSRMLS